MLGESEGSGMKMATVLVVWRDSLARTGWHDSHEPIPEPSKCTTIGFLIEDTEDHLALSFGLAANGDLYNILVIPKEAVVATKPIDVRV